MIMKMTRSTSSTSISGTTFISDMIPRFEPPTAIPMSHLAVKRFSPRGGLSHHPKLLRNPENLLASLDFRRDQTDFVDARPAHDIDGPRDFGKQYIVIAFDESDFLGAVLEDLFDAWSQAIPSRVFVVDL